MIFIPSSPYMNWRKAHAGYPLRGALREVHHVEVVGERRAQRAAPEPLEQRERRLAGREDVARLIVHRLDQRQWGPVAVNHRLGQLAERRDAGRRVEQRLREIIRDELATLAEHQR